MSLRSLVKINILKDGKPMADLRFREGEYISDYEVQLRSDVLGVNSILKYSTGKDIGYIFDVENPGEETDWRKCLTRVVEVYERFIEYCEESPFVLHPLILGPQFAIKNSNDAMSKFLEQRAAYEKNNRWGVFFGDKPKKIHALIPGRIDAEWFLHDDDMGYGDCVYAVVEDKKHLSEIRKALERIIERINTIIKDSDHRYTVEYRAEDRH